MPEKNDEMLMTFASEMLTMIQPWNDILKRTGSTKTANLPNELDSRLFGLFVNLWLQDIKDGNPAVHVDDAIDFLRLNNANARTYLNEQVKRGYLERLQGEEVRKVRPDENDNRRGYYRLHPEMTDRISEKIASTRDRFRAILID